MFISSYFFKYIHDIKLHKNLQETIIKFSPDIENLRTTTIYNNNIFYWLHAVSCIYTQRAPGNLLLRHFRSSPFAVFRRYCVLSASKTARTFFLSQKEAIEAERP